MTVSGISKYARLLTGVRLLGLMFEWAKLQEKLELAPVPQNLPTTLFHFFSLYPLLSICTLPSFPLSPEWAGKSCGRLAAHTPGRQIRTRPPAGPFHPLPECRRDRRIRSYFYSSPPYPFFSSTWRGWLGFGNGRVEGGKTKTKRHEKRGGGSGYSSNRRWRKKKNARCPFQMDGKWLGRGDLLDNYTVQANQFSTFTAWSGLIRPNKGLAGGGGTWEMGRPGVSGMGRHLPPSETAREHMARLWTY